jgi:hypothetical protein
MRELTVINQNAQSKKHDQPLSIIEYSYLTLLDLSDVHDDYIEQFLVDTKMSLPYNVYLIIHYQPLKRVTHNFQRTTTRINCAKLGDISSTR